jgi:hypothetical protein
MSDYLGNLIARTVSPAVAVRPQLPSLFEPAPVTRETVSWPEFEQESFVEQPPVTGPSEKLAPVPLSIPTPRQSVLRGPQETVPEISPAKKILEARQESEPVPPASSISESVQPRIFPRAAPTLHKDGPSDSTGRRSDIIKSPLLDAVASASNAVNAREETGRSQPAVALKPFVMPEPPERELPARSDVQAVVPTIRPLPPIAPLPAATAIPAPTINVTIGRVEVRAVPPPAQQRAKPKPASVLSLEDYLRHRAKGVSR